VILDSGDINLGSGSVTLSEGSVTAASFYATGDMTTTYGNVELSRGDVNLDSGDLNLESGNVTLSEGSVTAASFYATGDIITTNGNVELSRGDVNLELGNVTLSEGSVTAVSLLAFSDYRLKYDVHTISGSYYTVDNLRPVTYNFKHSGESHLGFIAHELQEQFPTAVLGEKDGTEMQSVNYAELIPVLVKEIQDLKKEVSLLKRQYLMM
jgi:hypothetical protein